MNNGQTEATAANHAITMAAINLRETIASENSTTRQLGPSQHATYRHREMVGWLREEWPDLWEAIDRLVATTKGYRT